MAPREVTAGRILLTGLVDYAGLFPPASLGMDEAVARYAEYACGEFAWALGRFVVPVERLKEFEVAGRPYHLPWRLSIIGDYDICRHYIEAIERRVDAPDQIRLPERQTCQFYFEIPIDVNPTALLGRIGEVGAHAKARTGGLKAEDVPSVTDVARFLDLCTQHSVPFKFTAGLHHAIRGEYPLSYENGSNSATMHGYLNVFLAAAYARAGIRVEQIVHVLEERTPGAFAFDETGVTWRDVRLTCEQLTDTRQHFAISFGSCAFAEPIEEACKLGIIP
jgi:hypothetical protein